MDKPSEERGFEIAYSHLLPCPVFDEVIRRPGWSLSQNPLTSPFCPFLPKVLSEAERDKIVTV